MIRRAADFMRTPCETIEALDGLLQVKELFLTKSQECFPVMEDGQVLGVLTWQDFVEAHPNRIVADAMSDRFAFVELDTPFWQAREMLVNNNLAALLVREQDRLIGLLTPIVIKQELGKHCDLLTGLYKADYLYYHALRLMASGQEISIIFADVNDFGIINKHHGHIKGDLVLKEFSVLLKEHMPPDAYLCRFGGDEFVVLIPGPREYGALFARNLEQAVAVHTFTHDIPVTVSMGIATSSRNGDRFLQPNSVIASLINMASLASTAAKKDIGGISILDQVDDSASA